MCRYGTSSEQMSEGNFAVKRRSDTDIMQSYFRRSKTRTQCNWVEIRTYSQPQVSTHGSQVGVFARNRFIMYARAARCTNAWVSAACDIIADEHVIACPCYGLRKTFLNKIPRVSFSVKKNKYVITFVISFFFFFCAFTFRSVIKTMAYIGSGFSTLTSEEGTPSEEDRLSLLEDCTRFFFSPKDIYVSSNSIVTVRTVVTKCIKKKNPFDNFIGTYVRIIRYFPYRTNLYIYLQTFIYL